MNTHPFVIAIGRQLGSGGKQVGEYLSQQLGVPVYDRRLIIMAAEEQGFDANVFRKADEIAAKGNLSKLAHAIASPFITYRNTYDNPLSHESLFRVQADIIRQKAEAESCIMVGRCSDYILREHPRHLSVFIRADMDDRIQAVAQRFSLNHDEAKELIIKNDRQRAQHHDLYAETNWGTANAYDLCINASRLGVEGTAKVVLDYAKRVLNIQNEE